MHHAPYTLEKRVGSSIIRSFGGGMAAVVYDPQDAVLFTAAAEMYTLLKEVVSSNAQIGELRDRAVRLLRRVDAFDSSEWPEKPPKAKRPGTWF
jgi:hypothetical protein